MVESYFRFIQNEVSSFLFKQVEDGAGRGGAGEGGSEPGPEAKLSRGFAEAVGGTNRTFSSSQHEVVPLLGFLLQLASDVDVAFPDGEEGRFVDQLVGRLVQVEPLFPLFVGQTVINDGLVHLEIGGVEHDADAVHLGAGGLRCPDVGAG
jgi:hypothetical protein